MATSGKYESISLSNIVIFDKTIIVAPKILTERETCLRENTLSPSPNLNVVLMCLMF